MFYTYVILNVILFYLNVSNIIIVEILLYLNNNITQDGKKGTSASHSNIRQNIGIHAVTFFIISIEKIFQFIQC